MKQWYILTVMTGMEEEVRDRLLKLAKEGIFVFDRETKTDKLIDASSSFGEILVPSVKEIVLSKDRSRRITRNTLLYPGYVFAELELFTDKLNRNLNVDLWTNLHRVKGLTKIMGEERNHRKELQHFPVPMTQQEIDGIRYQMGQITKPKIACKLSVGDNVKICEGSFFGYIGTIQSIDEVNFKAVISVSIFGGDTPVEIDLSSLEKVEDSKKN